MRIFIMRHAEAEMMAQSDKARQLTARGRQQSLSQGEWLKSIIPDFDKIISSTYTRAIATFEQINLVYNQKLAEKLEIWDGVTPYGNPEQVSDYLAILSDQNIQNVLLISHLPLVGEIIAELCGKNPISFYPSTIAEVEWDTETGKIIQSHSC